MKYNKQVGAALIGSMAIVSGVSAYQLYPRQESIQPLANLETTIETEEAVAKPVEKPEETVEITNPEPLPASEPVVQPTQQPSTAFNREALTRAIIPMIAKSNTAGGSNVTNETIHQFILRTYDANPAAFTPDNLQSVVDQCTSHLMQKYQELAGQPMAFTRYKLNNVCPL